MASETAEGTINWKDVWMNIENEDGKYPNENEHKFASRLWYNQLLTSEIELQDN